MPDTRTLTVVIPALDEEAAISGTIRRCLEAREDIAAECGLDEVEIIVVSDGSTDATEAIARGFAGVKVLAFDANRGYGAAIKCGFEHGQGDLLSFLDADGTCDPRDLARLVMAIDAHNADIVLGSRMGANSEMPAVRRIGNVLFAWMLGLLSDRRIDDTASGMRVIRREALKNLYPLPDGLHFTPAMTARALLEGRLKLIEVPILYAERIGHSKLSVVKDGVRFLLTIVRAAMCYRPARPLLIAAAALGVLAFLVGAMPSGHWLRYGQLEEWMIYRILLASLLATLSAFTTCIAIVADRIATTAHGHAIGAGPLVGRLREVSRSRSRWKVAGGSLAVAVVVVWEGVAQYVTTGHVEMHWSRPVLASLLVMLVGMLILTALLLEMMELIVDYRAGGARAVTPDRVHEPHTGCGEAVDTPPDAPFDGHAETYDAECMRGLALSGESREYFAQARANHLAAWWSRSGRQPPKTIVDYGCGTGDGTVVLADVFPGAVIHGVDISSESIERAAERVTHDRVTFTSIHASEPHIPQADLIHMSGVLHHVTPDDRDTLIEILAAALTRQGVVAVFENNPLNLGTRWVMSRIPFDRDAKPLPPWETIRRLRTRGLSVEHIAYLFWFPRALAALRPLEPYLEKIPLGAQYAAFATMP